VADTLDDIVRYYRTNDEETRLTTNNQLEYLVTSHILAAYVPPSSRILELGTGTGQYASALAVAGHEVVGVELVEELAVRARERAKERQVAERMQIVTGDARRVAELVQGPFDVALLMGPLYHLIESAERHALMASVAALVKPGGVVMTSHLTRVGIVAHMLTRYPAWIRDREQVTETLQLGFWKSHPRTGDFRGYYVELDEMIAMHTEAGLEVVGIHSQDPCIGGVDEVFSELPEDLKMKWAEQLAQLSANPLAWGSGRTLACISKKPL
jgi:S-adenosylmethionine-dependent methyltransferase